MTNRRGILIAITALIASAACPWMFATDNAAPPPRAVVFFGDSLTAGYGLDDPAEAYPGLIAARITAARLPFATTNAGLSGETTAAGLRRVDWALRGEVAVFVLALGGNDALRGVPTAETEKNLQAIIDAVRRKSPKTRVVVAGMEAPPNMGADFAREFREIFARIAEKNHLPIVPFLLEGVGGVATLNQRDRIHPTSAGQQIVADNVWRVLEPVLREVAER